MHTHVTFVLDSSGSMSAIKDDTIGGFNEFLSEQQGEEGRATVSLYSFDNTVEQVYDARPVEEAPDLTEDAYTPGGQTALHDAITTAIETTDAWIDDRPDEEQPEHVVVPILTDGKENTSETPQDVVRERIETYQDEEGWEFLFIGANQDAALTAETMGMDDKQALSMDHSDEGTREAYNAVSNSVSRARQSGETGGFTDEERDRQPNSEQT
jgi:uncharacterized protein YegL